MCSVCRHPNEDHHVKLDSRTTGTLVCSVCGCQRKVEVQVWNGERGEEGQQVG